MAVVFLNFLGVNDYVRVRYGNEQFATPDLEEFVQVAILRLLGSKKGSPERLAFLLTEAAHEKNWDPPGKLRDQLSALGYAGKCVQTVRIPEGKDEDQLWQLFDSIIETVDYGDRLVVDVTHGFRSLPIIFTVALDYLERIKNAKLESVYYGAFEVLGHPRDVAKIPAEERGRAPIFDLTPFFILQQWSTGIEHLLRTGDGRRMAELTGEIYQGYKAELRERMEPTLKQFGSRLKETSEALICAVAPEIPTRSFRLAEILSEVAEEAPRYRRSKPLAPVLERIREAYGPLAPDSPRPEAWDYVRRQLAAAGLLFDYHRYMQAFTLLREAMIDLIHIAEKGPHTEETPSRQDREFYSQCFGLLHAKADPENVELLKRYNMVRSKLESLGGLDGFLKLYYEIAQWRNHLDHAWTGDPGAFSSKSFTRLESAGRKCIERFNAILDAMVSACEESNRALEAGGASAQRRMLVLLNHEWSEMQQVEARQRFGVEELLRPPPEIQRAFGEVGPEGELGEEQVCPLVDWLRDAGTPGDYFWVQGEHGLTVALVQKAARMGLVPVYATTRREAEEERQADGTTLAVRRFRHVQFRRYPVG